MTYFESKSIRFSVGKLERGRENRDQRSLLMAWIFDGLESPPIKMENYQGELEMERLGGSKER